MLGVGSVISDGGVHLATPVTITALGTGTGGAGTYTVTNANGAVSSETMTAGAPGGSGGSISSIPFGPNAGVAGIATMGSDDSTMGEFLYDNSGEFGKPLYSVFGNPAAGVGAIFEPGLPVTQFGQSLGMRISG